MPRLLVRLLALVAVVAPVSRPAAACGAARYTGPSRSSPRDEAEAPVPAEPELVAMGLCHAFGAHAWCLARTTRAGDAARLAPSRAGA